MLRYYYSHNTGLQAQSVLYTQGSLQAEAEEFLDPNKWSADGTVALSDYAFSKDGGLMAYSKGRSDISTCIAQHDQVKVMSRLHWFQL